MNTKKSPKVQKIKHLSDTMLLVELKKLLKDKDTEIRCIEEEKDVINSMLVDAHKKIKSLLIK